MTFKIFNQFNNLKYGLSEVSDGSMKITKPLDTEIKNRDTYFAKIGINPRRTVSAFLAHSNKTKIVKIQDGGKIIAQVDALITQVPNLFLSVTVADCFPVYFFDPIKKIIGLAHCGWRGTANNLVINTLEALGSNPQDVLIGIGPGIQVCHFEIKEDILLKFTSYKDSIVKTKDKIFVDLPRIITTQLLIAGVLPNKIEKCPECTYELKDEYFSFRRDKSDPLLVMMAYIGFNSLVASEKL